MTRLGRKVFWIELSLFLGFLKTAAGSMISLSLDINMFLTTQFDIFFFLKFITQAYASLIRKKISKYHLERDVL